MCVWGEVNPSPSPALGMNVCLVWWPSDLGEEVPLKACPQLSVLSWPAEQTDGDIRVDFALTGERASSVLGSLSS